jgi:CRISPR-associated protein Cas2
MLVVVSYDISDDRRRVRAAKVLEGAGSRVLESVFECDLTEREWKRLRTKLMRVVSAMADRLRLYFLCETCVAKTEIIGEGAVERTPDLYLVRRRKRAKSPRLLLAERVCARMVELCEPGRGWPRDAKDGGLAPREDLGSS